MADYFLPAVGDEPLELGYKQVGTGSGRIVPYSPNR